jgi:hypothetical protein
MSVPNLGVYMPENKSFKIQINNANPSNGQITGSYESLFSPEGAFTMDGTVGHYAWVFNDAQGKDGVAPFCISFSGSIRPTGRPYCIVDSWNGTYLDSNKMLLTGTRAYVNSKGVTESISLGTLVFSRV